jgi:hypothetical protein
MSPRVIHYRCATSPSDSRVRPHLPPRLAARDAFLLPTRPDGQKLASKPGAERPRLVDALSLLRAELADVLFVDSWADLGDTVTQALVFAELRQIRASLVVADDYMTDSAAAAQCGSDLLAHALAAASLRGQISPRAEGEGTFDDPGDLGFWDTRFEHARVAHRLTHTTRLSQKTIAEVLNLADFNLTSPTGPYTHRQVSQLLEDFKDDLWVSSPEPDRLELVLEPLLIVMSDDEETALAAVARHRATSEHRELPKCTRVLSAAPQRRAALLEITRHCDLVHTVFIAADTMSDDPLALPVVTSWLRRTGVVVIGETDAVDSNGYWESELGRAMREGTALFLRLRQYDRGTIVEDSQTLAHALREARRLEAGRMGTRAIARTLNELGIPPRRATPLGEWSGGAVSDFLKQAGR